MEKSIVVAIKPSREMVTESNIIINLQYPAACRGFDYAFVEEMLDKIKQSDNINLAKDLIIFIAEEVAVIKFPREMAEESNMTTNLRYRAKCREFDYTLLANMLDKMKQQDKINFAKDLILSITEDVAVIKHTRGVGGKLLIYGILQPPRQNVGWIVANFYATVYQWKQHIPPLLLFYKNLYDGIIKNRTE